MDTIPTSEDAVPVVQDTAQAETEARAAIAQLRGEAFDAEAAGLCPDFTPLRSHSAHLHAILSYRGAEDSTYAD